MSKVSGLMRALWALLSLVVRTVYKFGLTVAIIGTLVVSAHTAVELTSAVVKQRKDVLDLIYWRDPRKSGAVLVGTLLVLICLASFSFVTVVAYTGLTLLAVTLSFRVYKAVLAQIQKTDAQNPFKPYLEKEISVPQDRVHQQVDVLLEHGQQLCRQMRRLFLVEDMVDTVKFGLLLWSLTYVGHYFSGLTLVILALIGLFTIPKFYEVYQEPIDRHLTVAKGHVKKGQEVVQEKLPFLKKKPHQQ